MSSILNNVSSLVAFNSLNSTNEALSKTIKTLSTGLKINSSADDAAGFAISEKMRTQIYGIDVAAKNSQDGISMLQTAEGALSEINSMLQRMRELAVQASNDSLTSQDRNYIQLEIDEIKNQIDNTANTTQFNKKKILGSGAGVLWSSNDLDLKIKINEPLTVTDQFGQKSSVEGNYRIEVRANPGQAQVQKSNIMLINHENVTMERSINHDAGVNNIVVDNVPAGDYVITSREPIQSKATVTGVYGLGFDEIDKTIKAKTRDSFLENNASILFEVTHVDPEEHSVTVSAISHVLETDGDTRTYTQENIILTEGRYKDLSSILGVGKDGTNENTADGAFELQLDNSAAFSVGDKFVYNLTVARDVKGADRSVRISSSRNPEWPENWEDVTEVEKTNEFRPEEPVSTAAKVVFLIDNSGSMSTPFKKLRENMSAFISRIRNEGVDDVRVGVARFTNGLDTHTYNWMTSDQEIDNALKTNPYGGSVDIYKSVVETINNYDMSDVGAKHIVLITDTYNELASSSSYTIADAQNALASAGTTLSAVYNAQQYMGTNTDVSNLITANGIDMGRISISTDTTWGTQLVEELGKQIGKEAVDQLFKNTPLHALRQFNSIFPSNSSPDRIITINKDGVYTDVAISPTDTLETMSKKFDDVTGGTTYAELVEDPDTGELGIVLTTDLQKSTRVRFSGDREIVNIIGMRSCLDVEFSLDASKVTTSDIHFRNFYINSETGKVYDSDIVMTTTENEIPEYDTLANFEAAYVGQIPKSDVKISDINNFWNTQGVFSVAQHHTITITQGDGKTAKVTFYSTDTVEDVRQKLNNAIANDLEQSLYTDSNNFASFVLNGTELNQGEESVAGTFLIRSVIPGKAGELNFSCDDDDLLRALGLNTIQESSESIFTASVYDAHSGEVIANNMKAAGKEFKGLIPPGIDIEINSMAGINAIWNDETKNYVLSNKNPYSAFLHIKNNSTTFQIGANKGEEMTIAFSNMSSSSLGVENVIISSAERARKSITQIDRAINKVSVQRAQIGAYENSLEHTLSNLTTASSNITNAESRIRDADISKEYMEFVKLQILNQSGTSMLSQANQIPQNILSLFN